MQERLLLTSYAVLPGQGEDSVALHPLRDGAFLCVADGCGGLGSRRYGALSDHTGAFVASRLVTHALDGWARPGVPIPRTAAEGERICRELESELGALLKRFAVKHCGEESAATRIVGSMQRILPTTLCAAITRKAQPGMLDVCFVWAGDSRGYVLDADGLHQCTSDHLRGTPDPFESLYRDMPLSGLLSADSPVALSMRRMRVRTPCVVLAATDGAYGCLATPMEFEMLLLDTLASAASWDGWEQALLARFEALAHDDATLLGHPCGVSDPAELRRALDMRHTVLQRQFVAPVRNRANDVAFARERWQAYRTAYDWTEGGGCGGANWRI